MRTMFHNVNLHCGLMNFYIYCSSCTIFGAGVQSLLASRDSTYKGYEFGWSVGEAEAER